MKQLRYLTVTLLALLFVSVSLTAQVRINPKVGVNVSAVDAKLKDIRAEARVGWNAGLDLRFGEGALYFTPGVHYFNYTARLIKDLDDPNDVEFKDETTIQNLKVPVNIGLRLTGEGGLLQLHAKGGVTPSYVLSVKEKAGFAFDKDSLKDWTFGANVGLGVDVLFLTVDLNYEIGLSDYFEGAEGKNNMLTLSAGIKF
ncbi:MAG: outer membrane beta-barrel protein [Saprospiraceae bacterium]|nr:outer membrane beta-barrel protein [Saprospiraceae bacterium]